MKLEDLDTREQISFGIAYFLEKFYVICLESNTVLTYNSSFPFNLEQEVTVEGLKSPHDIAASRTALYITDSSNNRIWKIDANHKSCSWMEEVGEPHTISVTLSQEEVLLVSSGTPSSVKFFASDVTLRRSFSLPDTITKPTHAVALADGHVILSHGGVGSCEQAICVLSADGKVIRTFPGESDCANLSWPCHLAIDEVRGLLFVVDFWNRRILVLNGKFHPVAEISRKSESPWRLCYVPGIQQLLVGADSTVEVYNVLAKA